jgi:mRNA interferase MazF
VNRGDIVIIADPDAGDFGRKPRPALVVQTNTFLPDHASVTFCLITSDLTGLGLFRIPVPAGPETGLLKPSEISIDKVQTVWRHRVGPRIGAVTTETMFNVDEALRRWLAL